MTAPTWHPDNDVELLENGEAFFPRVFEAIRRAEREVVIETFILFEDKVGLALHEALCEAGRRGVSIDLMIDGFGSPDLSARFLGELAAAGVKVRVFDPGERVFGKRLNVFRRMHRKIVVVDGWRAFIGGINYSADHLADFGPEAKQDYSVELRGPIVGELHRFVLREIALGARKPRWYRRRIKRVHALAQSPERQEAPPTATRLRGAHAAQGVQALLVTRDNRHHTTDIERHYLDAIRRARHRVVIANAYFFPGYRFIKALRQAARRGVDVRLILQGEPDMPIVKKAASMLYHHLLHAGVRIYEYCERPLHGKVALVDDAWSTVGSSNLDPLSLSLNLEANVVLRGEGFNRVLSERLEHLMRHSCKQIAAEDLAEEWSGWRLVRSFFVFHFLRWYPSLTSWLPRHAPQLKPAVPPQAAAAPLGAQHADVV